MDSNGLLPDASSTPYCGAADLTTGDRNFIDRELNDNLTNNVRVSYCCIYSFSIN